MHVARGLAAIGEFGFPADPESAAYLIERGRILQLGRVPYQVHIMTRITGVSGEEAWASREADELAGAPAFYIGRAALVANKRAAGRPKDLADAAALDPGASPDPSVALRGARLPW